jgi:uncharacterized protein
MSSGGGGEVTAPDTRSSLTTLSEGHCYDLLAAATVGRVGFVSPEGLQIIPVNFRLGTGPRIFMRVVPNGVVAQLANLRSHAAFEVDFHANDFRIAWSVLMQGTVTLLDAAARAAYADLHLPPVPWPGGTRSLSVQFIPRSISGRGLLGSSSH